MSYIFTSESVSEGHPDKICDQISDAILDAALAQDPNSRVAAECFITDQLVVVGGEMTTSAKLDIPTVVKQTLSDIGYTDKAYGFDVDSAEIRVTINQQSADISQGVTKGQGLDTEMGAGDQGIMFGYACDQTESYMPLAIDLSHKLVRQLAHCRKHGILSYLRPDSKAQVSVQYEGRQPVGVDTVLISTQHSPDVEWQQIHDDLIEHVINPIVPDHIRSKNYSVLVNPTGRFVIGGPKGDAGLTGRKIIVDTYGGWARHGGGAFSGKDSTKVDRSAAYMARYIAKHLVAAGFAREVEIQLAYAIGISTPISIHVDTKSTGVLPDNELIDVVKQHFDLTPEGIINTLQLTNPMFRPTAAYGHFGRDEDGFTWEKLDKLDALKESLPQRKMSLII